MQHFYDVWQEVCGSRPSGEAEVPHRFFYDLSACSAVVVFLLCVKCVFVCLFVAIYTRTEHRQTSDKQTNTHRLLCHALLPRNQSLGVELADQAVRFIIGDACLVSGERSSECTNALVPGFPCF